MDGLNVQDGHAHAGDNALSGSSLSSPPTTSPCALVPLPLLLLLPLAGRPAAAGSVRWCRVRALRLPFTMLPQVVESVRLQVAALRCARALARHAPKPNLNLVCLQICCFMCCKGHRGV